MHTETRQVLNLGSQDFSKETLSAAPFVNNGKGWEVRKKG